MRNDLEGLKALGRTTEAPTTYDLTVLDAFANRHPARDCWVTFTAPEFTTLCPKTDPFVNGGPLKALAKKRFEAFAGVRQSRPLDV